MEEKELFEDYEFKSWQLTPRLYKIFGVAAIIQFLIFVVIGQFNLLQSRACDTVIAGKVCEVLDAVYVGSNLLDNKEWVDRDYIKDTFKEAEITYVDVTNAEPPFTYPEGYFTLVNPDELTTEQIPDDLGAFAPTVTEPTNLGSTDSGLIAKKQILPKVNNKAVKGDLSDQPLWETEDNKIAKQPPTKTPKSTGKTPTDSSPKIPKVGGSDTAKNSNTDSKNSNTDAKKDEKTEPTKTDEELATFQPNKKPLNDFRDTIKEKVDKKEVDLTAPFSITIDGVLTKDGKLDPDPKKTHYINPQGDQKMIDLAKSAIEAVNASGLFTYLDKLGGKRIIITLQQDKDNITAVIKSQVGTKEEANQLASGFNTLMTIGKITRKGKDEEVLLNAAKVTSEGKVFILNFAIPQQMAQDLIQKQLKDVPAEEKKGENGVTDSKNASASAGK